MNIDELTIDEVKQIMSMFPMRAVQTHTQPTFNGPVVANFIGRFVFVCNLEIIGDWCYLTNVRNIRYWSAKDNGLGDLATKGPKSDDKIDNWPDQSIPLRQLGPVMAANPEVWK